jgi:hypothetical protein
MSTVKRRLPAQPHLDVPKREARALLKQAKAKEADALDRIRRRHTGFHSTGDDLISTTVKLSDAQWVIAREYSFSSWAELKQRISGNSLAQLIDKAIRSGDTGAVTQLLTDHKGLLDVPIVSGDWGPPMSHAANLGRLEMVKIIATLGAKDFQHAFDRALLQGHLEIAGWLIQQGAQLLPGIIMGSCETLNDGGFSFLDEAGAPLTDVNGDRLAPLAMVLETYSRNPEGKHAILKRLRARGYQWPDDAIMAFHCGDLEQLKVLYQKDPRLIHRRYSYPEIYPPQLGCHEDQRLGLHGTPIAGTTLLHLSIDFDERLIFDWLLEKGADVNAAADIDQDGFGGHTPVYNALVGSQRDDYMVRRLLESGANVGIRVDLRKYLDWTEKPGWYTAINVTPVEWAAGFPEKGWVNEQAVRMCE